MVGGELLPLLLADGHEVRALVRDPRRLGAQRVNVQIALGDLSDPFSMRHAMRGWRNPLWWYLAILALTLAMYVVYC